MKNITDNKHYKMGNSTISYYDLSSNYTCEYKTYDKIRFFAVLSGAIEYTFSTESAIQTNTGLFIIPRYSEFTLHAAKPTKLMVIEADDELVKSIYQNIYKTKTFNNAINEPKQYINMKYTNALYRNVQKVHAEYSENSSDPYLVELCICRLIYHLLNTEYAGYLFSIQAVHPMEQVKYYIERNIKENIKINELADIAGMNSSNFTNTFKRHYGTTPMSYICERKMKFAEELLKENTVTDVALDMGFENISSFISQFKKVYEMTPKQYQILNL